MNKCYTFILIIWAAFTPHLAFSQLFGWNYETPVTIVETSGSPQYGYQAKVILDTRPYISASQMSVIGSDIRFGNDQYGDFLYPYWIESGINTDSTIFWIKLDTLLGYQCKTIYMFYGNGSAPSVSSLDGTFDGPYSATDSVASGGQYHSPNPVGIGFSFKPGTDILVTQLGRYAVGTQVTLFDYADETVLAQVTTTGAALGYFYAAPPAPLWLTADTAYAVSVYITGTANVQISLSAPMLNHYLSFIDGQSTQNSTAPNGFPGTSLTNNMEGFADFLFYARKMAASQPRSFIGIDSLQLNAPALVNECYGQPVQIGATATGNAGNLSYIWTPTTGLSNAHIATPTVNAASNQNYVLNARDAGTGCIASEMISVVVSQPGASTINDSICNGGSLVIGTHIHTSAGNYTDTLYNATAGGCDSIVSLHLTVHTVLHPVITCAADSLATSMGYTGYQWLLNNVPINGSTTNTLFPITNGQYKVVVTDVSGCSDTSSAYTFSSLGIDLVNGAPSVIIYPNPATTRVTITFSAPVEKSHICVTNDYGQTVYTNDLFNAGTLVIDTHLWAPGIYIFNCQSSKGNYLQKIVKAGY